MTDQEHADEVRKCALTLARAIRAASKEGLRIELDTRRIDWRTMGDSSLLCYWDVTATVSRPL
jgi:hypothetical protein